MAGAGPLRLGMTRFGPERLGVLDHVDVALVSAYADSGPRLLAEPLVREARVTREGRFHVIPVDLAASLASPHPAVTGYLLDGLAPFAAASAAR